MAPAPGPLVRTRLIKGKHMKHKRSAWIVAVAAFSLLPSPSLLNSQESHHYKLVDIGTLGGPVGYGSINGGGPEFLFQTLNGDIVIHKR